MKEFRLTKSVLLLTFNRLDYLPSVWAEVAKAKPPRLYLASDGPRPTKAGEPAKVQAVRDWMLSHIDWPCEVKTRFLDVNSGGCGPGVSGAVSWFFSQEKDGIILEDDCVPSQTFFRFCQECLDRYADDKRVWHITGTNAFESESEMTYWFSSRMLCCGWASWADRWNKYFPQKGALKKMTKREARAISSDRLICEWWRNVEIKVLNGEADSWAYLWSLAILLHQGACIIPFKNFITNIGDEGVHFSKKTGGINHAPRFEIGEIRHPGTVAIDQMLNDRLDSDILRGRPRLLWGIKLFCENELPIGMRQAIVSVFRKLKSVLGRHGA